MSGPADFIIQIIAQNFWFIYSMIVNFILFFILLVIAMRQGGLVGQIIKLQFGMFKKPAFHLRFTNAQITSLQIREYSPVIKNDEKDPTSELIDMNKEHAFQLSTVNPQKIGLFQKLLGAQKSTRERLNELYTDDFIPIDINKKAVSHLWGIPVFVTVEGVNSTINPLMSFTQKEQVRAASIAVEQSLLANKLIAEDKFRKEIATKSDVRNWAILCMVILGIGIAVTAMISFGAQQTLGTLVTFVNEQWTKFQPLLTEALKNTPHIIYDSKNGSG